jgi:hypothetical protein
VHERNHQDTKAPREENVHHNDTTDTTPEDSHAPTSSALSFFIVVSVVS